jgi:hypothetical protein
MGNDIVAHRIVIGLFYHKIGMACCRKVKLIVSFNLYDISEKHKGKKIPVYTRCQGIFFHRSCMDGILCKQK